MSEFECEFPGLGKFGVNFSEILKNLITCTTSDPEKEFFNVYNYLKNNRFQLAKFAMEYYTKKSIPQLITGVNLLCGAPAISQSDPIDLNYGEVSLLELKSITKRPDENPLIHGKYFPWHGAYVDNILVLNKKIIEQNNLNEYLKPKLFNAPIYQLVDFKTANGLLTFTCCSNTYFEYVNNCEFLLFEFARAIYKQFIANGKSPDVTKLNAKLIPFRKAVDVFNFTQRCVGIGISTLFIMKDNGNVTFFKHKRTPGATMEGINTEHVVPAGTFQPREEMPNTKDLDFNIYKNILRELGEELLGREEMEGIKQSHDDITNDEHIKKYHNLFVKKHAKAFFLGWGLDPLTTKAEFLTALVVDIREFRNLFGEPQFKHNWEGAYKSFPFDKETIQNFVNGQDTLPAGAGCAYLAWQYREQLLKK